MLRHYVAKNSAELNDLILSYVKMLRILVTIDSSLFPDVAILGINFAIKCSSGLNVGVPQIDFLFGPKANSLKF